jgi:sec-independent protein translocase protein TatB
VFNLQGSEIIIVMLLALVVLGPEKLPDAMRKMGQVYAELKKMSSGFQSEFRSVVEEPMREIRDTANVLRDSADFTKLQAGERDEKPQSGSMADLASSDGDDGPTAAPPSFDTGTVGAVDVDDGPAPAPDSKPSPFSGESTLGPTPAPAEASPAEAPPADAAASVDEADAER